ncbi:hypothetical protein [Mycobacteroides franklinii]|uniref:Minor tail protein n=1 Tax=Mycobacteroides franklinii TaxID=948102 RepID=A0A4R5P6F0_9MYCO|nr:hypothetical protein [Mycobacteroides franklinii]ORA62216.1 hypothetical protein BST24_08735 [Mycobacteroides franklinii]TDH19012.1 hypothetical protein EJ571_20750 [Mycobacteroides franklinii]
MSRRNQKQGKVFPKFPYDRKFTKTELDEIFARQDRLCEAFRDAVGPNGWGLGMPEDHLQLLMFHGALAGADVDEDNAFIRPRRLPDESGRLVDAVEWVVKKEDTPRARNRDARREARARAREIDELDPEVRDALIEMVKRKGQRAYDRSHAEVSADDRDEYTARLADTDDEQPEDRDDTKEGTS